MTRRVFADSGAWIALFATGDSRHGRAAVEWRRLRQNGDALFTTDYVLQEVATLIARTWSASAATETYRKLLSTDEVRRIWVAPEYLAESLVLFDKFSDHPVSFVDASSFAVMRRLGIQSAWTYDFDFVKAGFELRFPNPPRPPD